MVNETVEYVIEIKSQLIKGEIEYNKEIEILSILFALEKNLDPQEVILVSEKIENFYHSWRADEQLNKLNSTSKKEKRKEILTEITDIEKEIECIIEERNKLNNLTKQTFEDSNFYRDERNSFNNKIKLHKTNRNALQKNYRENKRIIQDLETQLRSTGNLTQLQEREILDRINDHDPDYHHSLVVQYHEYSQKNHEEFISLKEKAKEYRQQADKLHNSSLVMREKLNKVRNKLFSL